MSHPADFRKDQSHCRLKPLLLELVTSHVYITNHQLDLLLLLKGMQTAAKLVCLVCRKRAGQVVQASLLSLDDGIGTAR